MSADGKILMWQPSQKKAVLKLVDGYVYEIRVLNAVSIVFLTTILDFYFPIYVVSLL